MSASKSQTVQALYAAMPYPNQIVGLDLETEDGALRFTWRGSTFRVSVPGAHVEQVVPGFLSGSDLAILVEHLVKRGLAALLIEADQ